MRKTELTISPTIVTQVVTKARPQSPSGPKPPDKFVGVKIDKPFARPRTPPRSKSNSPSRHRPNRDEVEPMPNKKAKVADPQIGTPPHNKQKEVATVTPTQRADELLRSMTAQAPNEKTKG